MTTPAPESERAITHDEAMEAAQALIDHMFRNVTTHRVQTRVPAEPTDTDVLLTTYIRQQKEKDATAPASCSEVVERLRLALQYHGKAQAEAILHEWREREICEARDWGKIGYQQADDEYKKVCVLERRVQELEECLRETVLYAADYAQTHELGTLARTQLSIIREKAEQALANSEWREQIRKGE